MSENGISEEGRRRIADLHAATLAANAAVAVDSINHPAHYTHGAVETIDAIEAWALGFHLGNAVKYISRAEHKGSKLSDLRKARWYLDREISRLEKSNG